MLLCARIPPARGRLPCLARTRASGHMRDGDGAPAPRRRWPLATRMRLRLPGTRNRKEMQKNSSKITRISSNQKPQEGIGE